MHFFYVTALLLLFPNPAIATSTQMKCALADKASREFTLSAQNNGLSDASRFLDTSVDLFKNVRELEIYFERQFRSLRGKAVHHSVPTKGPEHEKCFFSDDGTAIYRDHRILLAPNDGNGIFQILPVSVHLRFTPKTGWKVIRFASTTL